MSAPWRTRTLAWLRRRGDLLIACAAFAAVYRIALYHGPTADGRFTDVFIYREYGWLIAGQGDLPYHGFQFEYPPLAAAVFALAFLWGGLDHYPAAFEWQMLLWGVALVAIVGLTAERLGLSPRRRRVALALAASSPLLTGALMRTHFDLVPATLAAAAVLALLRERPRIAFALMGAGAMTKFFPLLLLPVGAAWLWARRERLALLESAAACVAVMAALSLPFAVLDATGYRDAYSFQLDRPVQIESAPASLLLAVRAVGGADVTVTGTAVTPDRFKSNGLRSGLAGPLTAALAVLMVAAVAAAAAGVARAARSRPGPVARLALAGGSLAAIAAFAAFGKVLSPQFVVWLIPWAAVLAAAGWIEVGLLSAAALVLTQVEFPDSYVRLVGLDGSAATLVGARNAVLAALVGATLWRVWRLPEPAGSQAAAAGRRPVIPPAPGAEPARWSARGRLRRPRSARP